MAAGTSPFDDVHARAVERLGGKLGRLSQDAIRDAATDLVAVSAVEYQENRLAFARVLSQAQSHGLTVDELVAASGRSEALVVALLREAS